MIQSKTFGGKTVLITGSANSIGKTIAMVYATNLRSTMIFSQYAVRHMALKSKGAIINISSTRALMSELTKEDHEQHFRQRVGKATDISRACLYLSLED